MSFLAVGCWFFGGKVANSAFQKCNPPAAPNSSDEDTSAYSDSGCDDDVDDDDSSTSVNTTTTATTSTTSAIPTYRGSRRGTVEGIKARMMKDARRNKTKRGDNRKADGTRKEFNWSDILSTIETGSIGAIPTFLLTPAVRKRIEFRVHSLFNNSQIKKSVFSRSLPNEI